MPYSQEALNSVLEEIKMGTGLRAAAKKYHVPVTTLHDHISGAKKEKIPYFLLHKRMYLLNMLSKERIWE
jgi:hypothetical protein